MEKIFLELASLNIFLIIILLGLLYYIFNIFFGSTIDYSESHETVSDSDIENFNTYLEETNKRIVLNIENYDKNLLTLATFLLGLSLIFIKDIIGTSEPIYIQYIHSAWTYFLVSIVMTILSFIIGVKDNELATYYYYKELIVKDNSYKNKTTIFSVVLKYMLFFSGAFLFLGMLYLYLFVKSNF